MQLEINLNGQTFTQSEIELMDACPYKWYLRYQLQLELSGHISWPLIIGTAWHIAMETLYQSQGKDRKICNIAELLPSHAVIDLKIEKEIEYWTYVLEAMLGCYATFYKDDFKRMKVLDYEKMLEVTLEYEDMQFIIAGKRDMKVKYNNKTGIIDHKTAGQISPALTEGWSYRFQFMLYLWLDWKCSTKKDQANSFIVNVAKKPALRLGKDEHINTFASRVRADMLADPLKYFYRQELDLTEHGLMHFEENLLLPKLKRFAILQKYPHLQNGIVNQSTSACHLYNQQCEYFAHCYHGESKQFVKREVKHEELVK